VLGVVGRPDQAAFLEISSRAVISGGQIASGGGVRRVAMAWVLFCLGDPPTEFA
jgi:hypothetical protein